MAVRRGSGWRMAVVGLVLAALGACAHGGARLKLSAGDGAAAATSTTGLSDATTDPSATTSTGEPASSSTVRPSTSTSPAPQPTTTTSAPVPCTDPPPASTTTTTAGGDGSYDTTSVTGLPSSGGWYGAPPSPPCPLKVAGSWRTFAPGPLASRTEAVGVWTGHEMVIVGGLVGYAAGTDGAAYNPQTGRWRTIAARPDSDKVVRLGAWTGKELVVFGVPRDNLSGGPTVGAAYDPATNGWRTIAPPPAELSTGQLTPMLIGWTGSQVALYEIGWGGVPGKANLARAGLYDPATDRWTVLPLIDDATAVGRAGIAGGRLAVLALTKGAGGPEPRLFLYDTDRGEWHESPVAPVAIPSYPQVAPFWSGQELIVTRGSSSGGGPGVGYDPAADRWRTLNAPTITDVPFGQRGARLGDGRSIAQIDNANGPLGVYDAGRDSWTGSGAIPGTPPTGATAVSTGHDVLLWGMRFEGGIVHADQPSAAWIWTPAG